MIVSVVTLNDPFSQLTPVTIVISWQVNGGGGGGGGSLLPLLPDGGGSLLPLLPDGGEPLLPDGLLLPDG